MRDWLIVFAIALAVIAVFGQVVTFDFVDFDDDAYVSANEHVQEALTLEGLGWALTTGHAANWHPLTWVSHMLDWQLYGARPGGHHLTNLILHLANSLLLFGLLRQMTGRRWPSALVAALFALHPLHVESVAWVAERKDLLSTLFGWLSLWAYQAYARRSSRGFYLLTLLLLAMGLMAKPMLVTLPFVCLLLDYWPLDRWRPRDPRQTTRLVLEKIPLLVLVLASSAITLVVQRSAGAVKNEELIPLAARLANAAVSYVRYLWLMFWPVDLSLLYPHPSLPGGTPLSTARVIGSALLLLTITSLVIVARHRRYLPVGWLWYLGTLIPVIGVVQVGAQALADRYTYVPLVGVWIMLAWGLADLARGALADRPILRRTLVTFVAILLLGLAVRAHEQASYWKDSVSLYVRSLEVTPSSPILHNNLGGVLESRGEIEQALEHYRQAVALDPGSAGARTNLAGLLLSRGDSDEAVRHYRRSLELRPGSAETHNGLGNALAERGELLPAVEHYRRAIEIDPEFVEARYNVALTLGELGRADAAFAEYERVLQIRPDHAPALTNSGNLLLAQDRHEQAARRFALAIRSDPQLAEAHSGLGMALVRSNRADEARRHLTEALRLRPEWLSPMTSLAWLLATQAPRTQEDVGEAIRLAERAAELTGGQEPRVLDTLAAAYASDGRFEEALTLANRAAAIADSSGAARLAAQIRRRARLYAGETPYRRPG